MARETWERLTWYLAQHQFSIHVHGEIAEVKQHLVGGKLLFGHILPVENNDGHAQEQVEIVSLEKEREVRKKRGKFWTIETFYTVLNASQLIVTVWWCILTFYGDKIRHFVNT